MISGTPALPVTSAIPQSGSLQALSLLAANPEVQVAALATGVVVGGVTIAVGAVVFGYKEYKEYVEKIHLEEIKQINNLHNEYLAKIFVPGRNEILSLPIIFKIKPGENNTHSIESIHFNEDIVRDKGTRLPGATDIALSKYQEAISNAIVNLKRFYFSRSEKNDIKASVISYLLEMLDTHCLKFEGYDYDIAYLKALSQFINAFASRENRVNTKTFSHLDEVYSHLVTAQQLLDLHKDKLTLEERVAGLNESCRNLSNKSIRNFSMMVNPTANWELIENVTNEELSNGMLKKYFVSNDFLNGLITIPDNEVDIFNSPFKSCLMKLAGYALKSIDPDYILAAEDIPNIEIESEIIIPDIKRFNELKQKKDLTKDEKAEKKKIKNQLEDIKNTFYKCKNFITTELNPKTKKSKHEFISVTEYDELVKRVHVIKDFANLIHEILSVKYFAMSLIKNIRKLGEIDITSPQHQVIFMVIDELCHNIHDHYTKLKKDFYAIQGESDNAMQLLPETKHRDQIYELLETMNTTVSNAKEAIHKYWSKNKNNGDKRKAAAENSLFATAYLLGKVHNLKATQQQELRNPELKNLEPISPELKKNSRSKKKTKSKPNQSNLSSPDAKISLMSNPGISDATDHKIISSDSAINNDITDDKIISDKLAQIHKFIEDIKQHEAPSAEDLNGTKLFSNEINAYMNLYSSLDTCFQKLVSLRSEHNKSQEHIDKANCLFNILQNTSSDIDEFVKSSRKQRTENVALLCQKIQKELSNPDNLRIINTQNHPFWKWANSKCGEGFFNTDSGPKLSKINLACVNLMNILMNEGKKRVLNI